MNTTHDLGDTGAEGRNMSDWIMCEATRFVVVRSDPDGYPAFLADPFDLRADFDEKNLPDSAWAASPWNAVRFTFRCYAQDRASRIKGARVEQVDVARRSDPAAAVIK